MTWVRELSKDAAGKLQVIEDEDPFMVNPTIRNFAGLADAIASVTFIATRHPTAPLKIFKLTAAGEWEKLEVDELLQPNVKDSVYGFLVPN